MGVFQDESNEGGPSLPQTEPTPRVPILRALFAKGGWQSDRTMGLAGRATHRALRDEWDSTAVSFQGYCRVRCSHEERRHLFAAVLGCLPQIVLCLHADP